MALGNWGTKLKTLKILELPEMHKARTTKRVDDEDADPFTRTWNQKSVIVNLGVFSFTSLSLGSWPKWAFLSGKRWAAVAHKNMYVANWDLFSNVSECTCLMQLP